MKAMNKKADVWISAVLYFGLGIVLISIILVAGMPVLNRLKDKNTIIQTKDIMFDLNNNIREVAKGGPGTQRILEMNIKKGNFMINIKDSSPTQNSVMWKYITKALLSEPGKTVDEGDLKILTKPSTTKGEFTVDLWLDYAGKLNLVGKQTAENVYENTNPIQISGPTRLVILNGGAGATDADKLIKISISEA